MKHTRIACIVFIVFMSCANTFDSMKVTIVTNIPDFTLYSEVFNSTQSRYLVNVVYNDSIQKSLAAGTLKADIVIASGLEYPSLRKSFLPLNDLFGNAGLKDGDFYTGLLRAGMDQDQKMVLPVSFNLPMAAFSRQTKVEFPQTIIDIEEIHQKAAGYNTVTKNVVTRIGYLPRWNGDFLYLLTKLFSANLDAGSPVTYNRNGLEKTFSFIQSWRDEDNGGIAGETEFTQRYFFGPEYTLAQEGRTLFAYQTTNLFFLLPEKVMDGLDYRWIARDEYIPVVDGSTYMGILRGTSHEGAARAFITWFFNPDTQKKLLGKTMEFRIRSFGIAGGLSSLIETTSTHFPEHYPALTDKIPAASLIKAPISTKPEWQVLKKGVVIPFLRQFAAGETMGDDKIKLFEDTVRTWELQHGED